MKKIIIALLLCIVSITAFTSCKNYKYKELETCVDSAFKYKDLPLTKTSEVWGETSKVCFSQCVLSDGKHFIVECDNETVYVYSKDNDAKFYMRDVCGEFRDYGYKKACILIDNIISIPCN